jgi:hypothetical protein
MKVIENVLLIRLVNFSRRPSNVSCASETNEINLMREVRVGAEEKF